jgi:hypothetical protein
MLMRTAVVLGLASGLLVGACGGDEDSAPKTGVAPTAEPRGEAVVIRTRLAIAATSGSEPIATGAVTQGSALGGSPFCVGGTIRDSHGSSDPAVWLIARTITCPDGRLRMELTPKPFQGLTQTGSWKIISGTGAFEGLGGSGTMRVAYDPDNEALAHETYTGTATR